MAILALVLMVKICAIKVMTCPGAAVMNNQKQDCGDFDDVELERGTINSKIEITDSRSVMVSVECPVNIGDNETS